MQSATADQQARLDARVDAMATNTPAIRQSPTSRHVDVPGSGVSIHALVIPGQGPRVTISGPVHAISPEEADYLATMIRTMANQARSMAKRQGVA